MAMRRRHDLIKAGLEVIAPLGATVAELVQAFHGFEVRCPALLLCAAHAGHVGAGLHARYQLSGIERLDDVVVGARLHALDAIFLASTSRDEDHRAMRSARIRAQSAQQSNTVEPRHHHIAQD